MTLGQDVLDTPGDVFAADVYYHGNLVDSHDTDIFVNLIFHFRKTWKLQNSM